MSLNRQAAKSPPFAEKDYLKQNVRSLRQTRSEKDRPRFCSGAISDAVAGTGRRKSFRTDGRFSHVSSPPPLLRRLWSSCCWRCRRCSSSSLPFRPAQVTSDATAYRAREIIAREKRLTRLRYDQSKVETRYLTVDKKRRNILSTRTSGMCRARKRTRERTQVWFVAPI